MVHFGVPLRMVFPAVCDLFVWAVDWGYDVVMCGCEYGVIIMVLGCLQIPLHLGCLPGRRCSEEAYFLRVFVMFVKQW